MKILILAYDFPPLISIGGQRPYSWYKYLPEAGINVTVLTRHWSNKISTPLDYAEATGQEVSTESHEQGNNTIIRAPFNPNLRDRILLKFGFEKFVTARKLLTYLYAYLEHLFFWFDSKSSIYKEARKVIAQNRPDLIIATAEPFILFKYAHFLSHEFEIPWIADYRDSWTSNQGNYVQGSLKNRLDDFYRRREKLYLNNAALITTAAPPYSEALHKIHPGKEIKVVYNGFDEAFFKEIDAIKVSQLKFVISYAGTLYEHQNVEMFLDGLLDFVKNENIGTAEMEVHFYGLNTQFKAKERVFKRHPELNGFLVADPRVDYAGLVKKLRASHILLLLSKRGANWLNAKIFDYIGVKRPIILIENDGGVLEEILTEMNAGKALSTVQEVSAYLKTAYELSKRGELADTYVGSGYLKYSRKEQAMVLSHILKSLNIKA